MQENKVEPLPHTIHKMKANFGWNKELKVKNKMIRTWEENLGDQMNHLGPEETPCLTPVK